MYRKEVNYIAHILQSLKIKYRMLIKVNMAK
jgi:hypothetical protein